MSYMSLLQQRDLDTVPVLVMEGSDDVVGCCAGLQDYWLGAVCTAWGTIAAAQIGGHKSSRSTVSQSEETSSRKATRAFSFGKFGSIVDVLLVAVANEACLGDVRRKRAILDYCDAFAAKSKKPELSIIDTISMCFAEAQGTFVAPNCGLFGSSHHFTAISHTVALISTRMSDQFQQEPGHNALYDASHIPHYGEGKTGIRSGPRPLASSLVHHRGISAKIQAEVQEVRLYDVAYHTYLSSHDFWGMKAIRPRRVFIACPFEGAPDMAKEKKAGWHDTLGEPTLRIDIHPKDRKEFEEGSAPEGSIKKLGVELLCWWTPDRTFQERGWAWIERCPSQVALSHECAEGVGSSLNPV
ncbi:hypothetical protein B0J14DRAFT_649116 [Halenospora varia]|nr:hypothetical protein B0J14DRAFT_649116 [Halenospora varia]